MSTDSRPIYAHFTHPDGSWYRLWITQTQPKTERGHPWHLHASYDKTGTIAPIGGTLWYQQSYGMSNWDFGTEVEVHDGVKPGDQVVLNPMVNLAEGSKVAVRHETKTG